MSHELITTYTFNGSENSLDITSIPTTYKDLQLLFKVASASSGYNIYPHLRLNNYSGSDYYQMEMRATASFNRYASAETRMQLYGGETDAGEWTVGTLDINDYNRDSGHSALLQTTDGSFFTSQLFYTIAKNTVGDITSLQFIADINTSRYFSSGSKVWLYGIGQA